jgi:hypothetical protein
MCLSSWVRPRSYRHVSERRLEVLLMGNSSLSRSGRGDIVRTG